MRSPTETAGRPSESSAPCTQHVCVWGRMSLSLTHTHGSVFACVCTDSSRLNINVCWLLELTLRHWTFGVWNDVITHTDDTWLYTQSVLRMTQLWSEGGDLWNCSGEFFTLFNFFCSKPPWQRGWKTSIVCPVDEQFFVVVTGKPDALAQKTVKPLGFSHL